MISITFNTALGLIAGLISLVVPLATMLLVWWQAPHQRDNQQMVLYMGSVATWGLAGLLLNLAVLAGWDPRRLHQLLVVAIALNSFATFALAVRFARLPLTPRVQAALGLGGVSVVLATPLIFSNRIVVLHGVSPDGLFLYEFVPMGFPFIAILLLHYLGALAVIWRHRQGPAGQLLTGALIIVGATLLSLIPHLGAYAFDVLAAAVASLLFARSILEQQLFGPLARLNADLANSNAQLTMLSAGLQANTEELRRARDAAEAANVAKNQFLANMSHELRTPLTSIIGYSDLIQIQLEEDGQINSGDIKIIAQAGRHLLALINDLLDVAKIEAGKVTLKVEMFEVAVLIDGLSATIHPLAVKNGNRLVVHCDQSVGIMAGDITRLRQMLINLLDNAVKFTHQGRIELAVRRSFEHGREAITFQVADTGIGMSPEQISRLFANFMQGDESNTRKYGGAGMGLALSQRLCRLMGGELTVVSQLNVGSTFVATIPVSPNHGQPELQPQVQASTQPQYARQDVLCKSHPGDFMTTINQV
jgi:signal transduction histidine kinase